jgi:hypothetical protein
VRHVQLDDAKAGREREPGAALELRHDRVDLAGRERVRRRVARVERHGARRERRPPARIVGRDEAAAVPRPSRRRLAPRVRELDAGHRAVRLDEARDGRERRRVRIGPQPAVGG